MFIASTVHNYKSHFYIIFMAVVEELKRRL